MPRASSVMYSTLALASNTGNGHRERGRAVRRKCEGAGGGGLWDRILWAMCEVGRFVDPADPVDVVVRRFLPNARLEVGCGGKTKETLLAPRFVHKRLEDRF